MKKFILCIFIIIVGMMLTTCKLTSDTFLVRFEVGGMARRLGIGTNENNIVAESGLIQNTTTKFFSVEEGSYMNYEFVLGAWQEGVTTPVYDFKAGKRYEVYDDGGVAISIREVN